MTMEKLREMLRVCERVLCGRVACDNAVRVCLKMLCVEEVCAHVCVTMLCVKELCVELRVCVCVGEPSRF